MAFEVDVIIPARHEEWLAKTIEDVLANTSESCGVIAVLDGEWPMLPVADHPRLTLIHNPVSIGQRASINRAALTSTAKYLCKLDAHCAVGPDFDRIMAKDCQPNWMVVPRLWNLYVYDWRCMGCGALTYQGPRPLACGTCQGTEFDKVVVWLPRNGEYWRCLACMEFTHSKQKPSTCSNCGSRGKFLNIENKVTDSMRYDAELKFQYHRDFPTWEGLAAFIQAKGESWIHRLLAADIEHPDEKLIARTREYVATYNSLPLSNKHKLRERAIKALEFIRKETNKTEAGKTRSLYLLNLIELAQGHLVESMSMLGACFFLRRDFFWEIGGCDILHGSWGQQGTENANKVWLAGGKVIVNRATHYCHMFRTQHGDSFPYGISGNDQEAAKQYSRNLWRNNLWPGQKYPLSFLLERFWPVPGWSNEDLAQQKAREVGWKPRVN